MALVATIPPNIRLPLSEPSFTADTPVAGYYGVHLETHLKSLGREIALPIEACVMMLLASGMREEVGSAPDPPITILPPKMQLPRIPSLFPPSPGTLPAGGRRLGAQEAEEQLGQRLQCPGGVLLGPSRCGRWVPARRDGGTQSDSPCCPPAAITPAAPPPLPGALKSYLRELPQPLMTFELYNEWVKVARWVQVLGWKSLVGAQKGPPPPSLRPSQHSEQGCQLRLPCGEIRTHHLVCPMLSRNPDGPKPWRIAIKNMAGRGGKAVAFLIAGRA